MTDQPTLGETFAPRRDRLKAAAWRMAVDGHRECGGPMPWQRVDPTLFWPNGFCGGIPDPSDALHNAG
jgi:hypothetical protein